MLVKATAETALQHSASFSVCAQNTYKWRLCSYACKKEYHLSIIFFPAPPFLSFSLAMSLSLLFFTNEKAENNRRAVSNIMLRGKLWFSCFKPFIFSFPGSPFFSSRTAVEKRNKIKNISYEIRTTVLYTCFFFAQKTKIPNLHSFLFLLCCSQPFPGKFGDHWNFVFFFGANADTKK